MDQTIEVVTATREWVMERLADPDLEYKDAMALADEFKEWINPKEDEILGLTCYPDLESIPGKIDLVDVFRQSDAVLSIAESAIAIGAKGLWLQLGVYHLRALALARSAGLTCVTDKCTKVEHQTLSLQGWSR